jgi:hypothetical protein
MRIEPKENLSMRKSTSGDHGSTDGKRLSVPSIASETFGLTTIPSRSSLHGTE